MSCRHEKVKVAGKTYASHYDRGSLTRTGSMKFVDRCVRYFDHTCISADSDCGGRPLSPNTVTLQLIDCRCDHTEPGDTCHLLTYMIVTMRDLSENAQMTGDH